MAYTLGGQDLSFYGPGQDPSGIGMWQAPTVTGATSMPDSASLDNNPFWSQSGAQFAASSVAPGQVPDTAAQSAGLAGGSGALMGAGIGAGLGILSSIGQQNAYKNAAKAAAVQTRFSPWSHLGGGKMPEAPNSLGQIAGLTASGATLGQGLSGGSLAPVAYMNRVPNTWNMNNGY